MATGKAMAQKLMMKVVKSAIKECDREYNLVMFNFEEEQEDGDSSKQYNYTARNVMKSAGLSTFDGDYSIERI